MDQNTQQRIDDLVKQNDVVLFMKGNASFPMCGFSGRAIQILKACGVEPRALTTVNVLEDEAVRQGIKEYSNWPTIPQLYPWPTTSCCSSPDSYISIMMSEPPMNSPFT